MKMWMAENKKLILKSGGVLTSLACLALFFTNTATVGQTIQAIAKESQSLQIKIDNPALGPAAKAILVQHKRYVSNYLAAQTKSRTCSELFSYDDTLLTGNYVLYPTGDVLKSALFHCQVQGKVLTAATFVRNSPTKVVATDTSKPRPQYHKNVTLNYAASGPNRINIVGVRGMPRILTQISSTPCKPAQDFGFDDKGIWVKNGCSAKFRVPVLMPLADRTITSTAANLNPILGRVNLPELDSDAGTVTVTGWACEQNLGEAINVQLFMGGPAGVGTLAGAALANRETLPGINTKCDGDAASPIVGHGFSITVPAQRIQYRRLFVHVVSTGTSGTTNGGLRGSRSRIIPASPKSYRGDNHCGSTTCSFEDRRDIQGINRFLVNNDPASVDHRCVELGYAWGRVVSLYTHAEWCGYSNARTKYWNGVNWVFGPCRETTVKQAVCH